MVTYFRIFSECRVEMSAFGNGLGHGPWEANLTPSAWSLAWSSFHKNSLGIFGKISGLRVRPAPVFLPLPHQATVPARCPEPEYTKEDSNNVYFSFLWEICIPVFQFIFPIPPNRDLSFCLSFPHSLVTSVHVWPLSTPHGDFWLDFFFFSRTCLWSGQVRLPLLFHLLTPSLPSFCLSLAWKKERLA